MVKTSGKFDWFILNIFAQVKNIFTRITNWEAWPFKLLYAPMTPVWGWYMLRSW